MNGTPSTPSPRRSTGLLAKGKVSIPEPATRKASSSRKQTKAQAGPIKQTTHTRVQSTAEERKALLAADGVECFVSPTEVKCAGCHKSILLDRRYPYAPGKWRRHRKRCRVLQAQIVSVDGETHRNVDTTQPLRDRDPNHGSSTMRNMTVARSDASSASSDASDEMEMHPHPDNPWILRPASWQATPQRSAESRSSTTDVSHSGAPDISAVRVRTQRALDHLGGRRDGMTIQERIRDRVPFYIQLLQAAPGIACPGITAHRTG